jgi:hypothetical protein
VGFGDDLDLERNGVEPIPFTPTCPAYFVGEGEEHLTDGERAVLAELRSLNAGMRAMTDDHRHYHEISTGPDWKALAACVIFLLLVALAVIGVIVLAAADGAGSTLG